MSDGRKYYCFCEANCKFETMTKEQILAAIAQAAETGLVFDTEAAFITKVKESNTGGFVTFWLGTQAQYNALVVKGKKDPQCFYLLTDCDAPAELTQKVKTLQQRLDSLTAADIGAAPAGYGLGESVPYKVSWNDHVVTGFFAGANPMPTGIDGYAFQGLTINYDGWLWQIALKTSGIDDRSMLVRKRTKDGEYGEWEWVNPPMVPNVEYRTTERYMGKSVYVKMFYFGYLGNSSEVSVEHGISDITQCIRVDISSNKTTEILSFLNSIVSLKVDTTKVYVTTNDNASGKNAYITLAYTKD